MYVKRVSTQIGTLKSASQLGQKVQARVWIPNFGGDIVLVC